MHIHFHTFTFQVYKPAFCFPFTPVFVSLITYLPYCKFKKSYFLGFRVFYRCLVIPFFRTPAVSDDREPVLCHHHLALLQPGPAHRHPYHHLHLLHGQHAGQVHPPVAQALTPPLALVAGPAAQRRCQEVQVS